jgi:hypothetical protein
MPVTLKFSQYLNEAFHAKYLGMFVSPAWLILGFFTFLGAAINPGYWLIGAGTEMAYLFTIATHPRFQAYVQRRVRGEMDLKDMAEWQGRVKALTGQLETTRYRRFVELKNSCDAILELYATQLTLDPVIIRQNTQSLNRLVWIFLQLLVTKQSVLKIIDASEGSQQQLKFTSDLEELDKRINGPDLTEDLRKSLESQREILRLRLQTQNEARQKLAYVEAELSRIEQQVELIKEQSIIGKDSESMASRIDLVSSSLSQTGEWIKQQEGLAGTLDDLGRTPPQIIGQREKKREAA